MNKVDIIIPIFGSFLLTKNCVESVLRYLDNTQRIILINDCSPEKEITEYLKKISKKNKKVFLIEHKENKGFVSSINEGVMFSEQNDVIILNSDTVVTKNWVSKLRKRAYSNAKIGTVTPFSNSATLFSYPRFLEKNDMPDDLDPETVNSYFEKVSLDRKEVTSLPTGMGYCMYIKREVIKKIGVFDEKVFGMGYGEENDFCMRAYYAGYVNVECANTFIYHYDGGSFGKNPIKRLNEAIKKVSHRHPYYMLWVSQFINENPFLDIQRKVDVLRYALNQKPSLLLILHSWGGGTTKHTEEIAKAVIEKGWRAFIMTPFGGGVRVKNVSEKESFDIAIEGEGWYDKILTILKVLNINHVHIHHFIGLPREVLDLNKDLKVNRDFTLHDFYSFCPRIHLTNTEKKFCEGNGDMRVCQNCLFLNKKHNIWLTENEKFLLGCRKLFAPSKNTAAYLKKYLPKLSIEPIPHFEKNNFVPLEEIKKYSEPLSRIKVGVIGNVSHHKGGDVIKACVELSEKEKMPIDWFLFGYIHDVKINENLIQITGEYKGFKDLEKLINKYPVDIVFLPSVWPETYSYILSESWFLGKPVLSADLGAISDRISATNGGWLVKNCLNPKEICNKIIEIKNNPKQISERVANIRKNFKPDRKFQWDRYYGDIIPDKKKISASDLKCALEFASEAVINIADNQIRIEHENAMTWIGHLEKDIVTLNQEINRLKNNRVIQIARKIMDETKKIKSIMLKGRPDRINALSEDLKERLRIKRLEKKIKMLQKELKKLKKARS